MPSPALASIEAYADWMRFGTLPHAGGTFDQPAGLMRELREIHTIVVSNRKQPEQAGTKRRFGRKR